MTGNHGDGTRQRTVAVLRQLLELAPLLRTPQAVGFVRQPGRHDCPASQVDGAFQCVAQARDGREQQEDHRYTALLELEQESLAGGYLVLRAGEQRVGRACLGSGVSHARARGSIGRLRLGVHGEGEDGQYACQ